MNDLVEKVKERGGQSFTAKQLYNTMHVAHAGYRFKNQGMAMACDWFPLLQSDNGVRHNPWSEPRISVVEIGCGNGRLCVLMAGMSLDVTGVDIFDNEAVYDRTSYKFVQQDLTKAPYPFTDNQFDYCISFDVLEHLPEETIDATLQEMGRIGRNIILAVSCTGGKPLHLTVKSPGWWLDKLIENCPDYTWKLLRNYERIKDSGEGDTGRSNISATDVRPLPDNQLITYAPLFHGKRGVIANED